MLGKVVVIIHRLLAKFKLRRLILLHVLTESIIVSLLIVPHTLVCGAILVARGQTDLANS